MFAILNPITWALPGWVGNVTDDDGVSWYVDKVDGWWQPAAVRAGLTSRPGEHGGFASNALREPRVVVLAGHAFADDNAACDVAVDQFNALVPGPGLVDLTVEEPQGTRTAAVRLADLKLERIARRYFVWQLVLTAPDPRRYGPWGSPLDTPLPTPGTGGIDASGAGVDSSGAGIDAGTASTAGIVTITATGRAPSSPVLRIVGPLPDATITVPALNVTLTFNGTIAGTQEVWINTSRFAALDVPPRSAVLAGVRYDHLLGITGGWPELAHDSITQWVFSSSGSDPAARLFVHYRPAWW